MKSEMGFSLVGTIPTLAVHSIIKRQRNLVFLILILITLLGFACPLPAAAQGLAISGTFYRQHFQLLPGENVSTPDIYLVVFNHNDDDIMVELTTQTPHEVEIMLGQSYFPIPAGEQQKVEVGVSVSNEAVPGEYLLTITAEVRPAKGEGIVIAGAVEQRAELTILGEAGEAPTTGNVTPETQACVISGFSVVPNYDDDTDKIAFANILYAIENAYQPLKSAKVVLRVSFNNEPLEQPEIISLPTLDLGSTSGSYKYIPSQGWQNGIYTFKLALLSQDEVCAQSTEEVLAGIMSTSATGINWNLIGAVVVVLLVLVLMIFTRRRLKKIFPTISLLTRLKKKAIYLETPEFSGVFNEKTGELVTARITYSINNQYKPVPGVRVELQARKGDTPFENITLVTLDPLEEGLINLEYDYAPEEGWQKNAAYNFKLALYIADERHSVTPVHAKAKSAS